MYVTVLLSLSSPSLTVIIVLSSFASDKIQLLMCVIHIVSSAGLSNHSFLGECYYFIAIPFIVSKNAKTWQTSYVGSCFIVKIV